MSLYLVENRLGRAVGMLVGDNDRPYFRSVEQVRNKMVYFDALNVELIHDSSFDEMIDNPDSAMQPPIIPLSW